MHPDRVSGILRQNSDNRTTKQGDRVMANDGAVQTSSTKYLACYTSDKTRTAITEYIAIHDLNPFKIR